MDKAEQREGTESSPEMAEWQGPVTAGAAQQGEVGRKPHRVFLKATES